MNEVFRETPQHAFEGWLLSPEGAAIHRRERTAVIADVHLGYEWARAPQATAFRLTRWRKPWNASRWF